MAVAEADSGLLFDEAQDQRLAQLYAPCFTLILQLRASHEFGDAEVLRQRILDLLDRSEREALRAGVSSQDLRKAKFALVAFIDETILSSEWSQKERWRARPLQLELYDLHDAGDVFFDRLKTLLEQPAQYAEVLEVYYLCMTLGFKGRYELYEQERLRMWIEETYKALIAAPGLSLGALAPHGKPRDHVADQGRVGVPTWVLVAFVAGLALLIYIIFYLMMNTAASRTIEAIGA